MAPKDYFSPISRQYAASRPRYPRGLYAWLATLVPARERAWDCACGNGQAAGDLVDYFSRVVGTDLSAEQLQEAKPHPRIEYRVALAERSGLPSASFDLVTVAQALHWFDCERFYEEARRVLRRNGVLAVWTYGVSRIAPAPADAVLQDFYRNVAGPYWTPERTHVEHGYQTLPFPQPELPTPTLVLEVEWSLEQVAAYVRSWSATSRLMQAQGAGPVSQFEIALKQRWGDPAVPHRVRWPLSVRAAVLNGP